MMRFKNYFVIIAALVGAASQVDAQSYEKWRFNAGIMGNVSWKSGETSGYLASRAIGTESLWGEYEIIRAQPE
jgi:hypothetical protein